MASSSLKGVPLSYVTALGVATTRKFLAAGGGGGGGQFMGGMKKRVRGKCNGDT